MRSQWVLVATALSIAAFAPVRSHQCEHLRAEVVRPVRNVSDFLKMGPDLDLLAGPGCHYILQQFNNLPQGAVLLRQIATQKVPHSSSSCVYWLGSVRYSCGASGQGGEPRCAPESYSYCGQWAYSMTDDPRYELLMELSLKLDMAYEKAQSACGAAIRWEPDALEGMQDLKFYLESGALAWTEAVDGESCGG